MRSSRPRPRLAATTITVGLVAASALASAPPASAHGPASQAAASLLSHRVVVDPLARRLVGQPVAVALTEQIGAAPLYVVVLAAGRPAEQELLEVEAYAQLPGIYLVSAGQDLAGGAVGRGGLGDLAVARTALDARAGKGPVAADLQAAVSTLLRMLAAQGRPAAVPDAGMVAGSTRAGTATNAGGGTPWVALGSAASLVLLACAALVAAGRRERRTPA